MFLHRQQAFKPGSWWAILTGTLLLFLPATNDAFVPVSSTKIAQQWPSISTNNPFLSRRATRPPTLSSAERIAAYYAKSKAIGKDPSSKASPTKTKELKKPNKFDQRWDEMFERLKDYKREHGDCLVPISEEDQKLANWVVTQRAYYRQGTLLKERQKKLESIDFVFSVQRSWEENYELLKQYKTKFGDCNVKRSYKEEDTALAEWVFELRKKKTKNTLHKDKIAKLTKLGFSWEPHDDSWAHYFRLLKEYKDVFGDCNVPKNFEACKELSQWVSRQRMDAGIMTKERRDMLNDLGFVWEKADIVRHEKRWNTMFERLKEYKCIYGDCLVPVFWEEDKALGYWVKWQRSKYKNGDLSRESEKKLASLGFVWSLRDRYVPHNTTTIDKKWQAQYEKVVAFSEKYNHTHIPAQFSEDPSLGRWVRLQRELYKQQRLRPYRKELLEKIDFTWSFQAEYDKAWHEKFEELAKYVKLNSSVAYLPSKNKKLYVWISYQSRLQARGKLDPKRKAMLDRLNVDWDIYHFVDKAQIK